MQKEGQIRIVGLLENHWEGEKGAITNITSTKRGGGGKD